MTGFLRPTPETLNAARGVPSPLAVDVSVIMVVYMTGPALFDSIDCVLAEERVGEFVLVDNGSTPEDEARLRAIAAAEPRVKFLGGHGNVGFARGANMGAAAATGRRLIFLNPDAFLQPGCVKAMEETLGRCGGEGRPCLIGANVMNIDGTEQRGARRGEVTPVTTLLSFTRLSERIPFLRPFEIHREEEPLPDAHIEVPVISGACFAMSREHFAALGGFDGGFFLHVEDVDLCWRVRQRGGRVVFQPSARVVHLGSTSRTHPITVEFWKGVGLARYFRKRADTLQRKLLAYSLGPLIIAVAVCRPTIRSVLGTHRKGRAGPHRR
jgi:GT2 family glycosyltransferase